MNYYKLVKDYYKEGFYTKEQVAIFVKYNKITPEQYKEITGEDYVEQLDK